MYMAESMTYMILFLLLSACKQQAACQATAAAPTNSVLSFMVLNLVSKLFEDRLLNGKVCYTVGAQQRRYVEMCTGVPKYTDVMQTVM